MVWSIFATFYGCMTNQFTVLNKRYYANHDNKNLKSDNFGKKSDFRMSNKISK